MPIQSSTKDEFQYIPHRIYVDVPTVDGVYYGYFEGSVKGIRREFPVVTLVIRDGLPMVLQDKTLANY